MTGPGRVLLLRALGLGDFLTGVPAYRAVRRAFPAHRIVLAAPAALTALVPLTGAIDELLPTAELAPVPWRGAPPAVGIDLHGRGPASHRLVAAVRPGRLIAFGGEHGGGFSGPPWYPGEHEVARWCRLLAESGIPADPGDLGLSAVPGRRPPGTSGVTIVHAGAAAGSRRWPPGRFAAVALALAAEGHDVRLTGSPPERGLALEVARRAGLPARTVVAGRTSLAALAALVASARLVIAGDTGLAHLATGFARPSVTLFGPVPPAEWGPPDHPRHQVLWTGGRDHRGDPHAAATDPALAAITVPQVLAAAARALRASAVPPVTQQPARTAG